MSLTTDITDLALRTAQEFNLVRDEINAKTYPISSIVALQAALDAKEPLITAGTVSQYIRGDKSLGTLDKAAVGLSNVDNTSDATKNAAAATLTNKTISGSNNTISNIAQASVSNLIADLAAKQPLNSLLTAFGALAFVNDDFLQYKSGALARRTIAQVKTDLGLQSGGDGTGYLDNQGNYTVPAGGGGPGGGETNLGANVGTSIGVFKEKSGVTLRFKSLHPASSKVAMVDDTGNDRITFDVNQANLVLTISQITNLQTNLDAKENEITAGTSAQYWRGDKVWAALNKGAVGLGAVDNTDDASKPVSTLQQAAIDLKLTKSANLSDLGSAPTARTNLGLGNVDNTSDVNKPVSTLQQAAIDLKLTKSNNLSDIGSVVSARTNLGLGALAVKTTIATADIDALAVTGAKIANGTITPAKEVAVQALTDAATVALDASLGKKFSLSSSSSRTIGIPSNPTDGQNIIIRFKNTAGTSQTLSLTVAGAGCFKFTDVVTALTATPAGKSDFITAIYDSADALWYVVGYAKGA